MSDTRGRILEAADQLFGSVGFDATTIRAIASLSGVNKALIHYHFSNKDRLLDHLLDPHNIGAIARSALAAGATGLVVPARRTAPLGPTAFKTAAGALERLRVSVRSSTADVVKRLKRLDVWTLGLTATGPEQLFEHRLLAEPVAIIVGGEGRGLGRLVEDRVDVRVRIPMSTESESLNASVAAALAVFEVARVRREL